MSNPSFQTYLQAAVVAAVIATVANTVIFLVGQALQVDFMVQFPGATDLQPVQLAMVAVSSVVPVAVAVVLLAVLQRLVVAGMKVFESIAVIVLILSLIPLWLSPANIATTTSLSLMHLAAFAATVGVFKLKLAGRQDGGQPGHQSGHQLGRPAATSDTAA
ncbi:MAG: hypothetical protein COU69_04555 [Candidatus Pacebacteria bacterium CG10_big_fil_rev_8_21_14_0_10_56_10]|nr:MAG: hypothetical protein COU69_04555 [Candidatus Pacebacteria bacterium CG10_big_fil_rev_8_21_14_0_10_56_10]